MSSFQSYPIATHSGSGTSKLVSFLLKENDLQTLDELVAKSPPSTNRSDIIREMIMPYLHAFKSAKEGKEWELVLKSGSGVDHLKNLIKSAENESSAALSYSI